MWNWLQECEMHNSSCAKQGPICKNCSVAQGTYTLLHLSSVYGIWPKIELLWFFISQMEAFYFLRYTGNTSFQSPVAQQEETSPQFPLSYQALHLLLLPWWYPPANWGSASTSWWSDWLTASWQVRLSGQWAVLSGWQTADSGTASAAALLLQTNEAVAGFDWQV